MISNTSITNLAVFPPFEKDPSLRHTSPRSTVFVRNLDIEISLDQLRNALKPFGSIVKAKIASPLANKGGSSNNTFDLVSNSKNNQKPYS